MFIGTIYLLKSVKKKITVDRVYLYSGPYWFLAYINFLTVIC